MKNRPKDIHLYVIADVLAAILTWIIFFSFRKVYIEKLYFNKSFLTNDINFFIGVVSIPIFWLLIYFSFNSYTDIYKKSRLNEIGKSCMHTFFGSLVLFFLVMINDKIQHHNDYYWILLFYVCTHLLLLLFFRLSVLSYAKNRIIKKKVVINTILIGSEQQRKDIKKQLDFSLPNKIRNTLYHQILKEVNLDNAISSIQQNNYEEAVIAIDQQHQKQIELIIIQCFAKNIGVKILADNFDILSGKYKTSNVLDADFIYINPEFLNLFQKTSKRFFDFCIALLALILLSPLLLIIAAVVKLSSKGKIIYAQERIGLKGKVFNIYKFRSMFENAETNEPLLTQDNDERITTFGALMRKYRIDELPQLFNVLIGDMSLVGPRPERQYFIQQILKTEPKYQLLHQIKPGITSLGMVKFGYAHNTQEMIQRMRYDLLYLENISLLFDLKIILYTISTVLKGKGK